MRGRAPRVAAAWLVAAGALGCQTPAASPLVDPLGPAPRFAPIVPDALDHAAADLAVGVLGGDARASAAALGALERAEWHHRRDDARASGLVPAGHEAANALLFPGRAAARAATARLLEQPDVDPAMRERLERELGDDPLILAEERLADARFAAVAHVFNAVSEPVGRGILNTTLLPYTLGRSLVQVAIDYAEEDPLPLRRRQALAHWQRFRRQYPDAPEGHELEASIESYQEAWRRTRYEHALARAEAARREGRPEAALLYARRALRHKDAEAARELAHEAEEAIALRHRILARAQGFREDPFPTLAGEREQVLAALSGPIRSSLGSASPVQGPASARLRLAARRPTQESASSLRAERLAQPDVAAAPPGAAQSSEQRFLQATALGRSGRDAAMWDALREIELGPEPAMARHAAAERRDPVRNAYAAFRRARAAERWRNAAWVTLGPLAARPDPGALGATQYLLDLPWRIQAVALLPLRLIQLPWRGTTPGDAETAAHARRYLAREPRSAHAAKVSDWLEGFERERENWVGTLRVLEARGGADDAELDALRERAAQQALDVAAAEERRDLRAGLLTNVARSFPETRAGHEAGGLARAQATERTPHEIRLSRGFLLENPEVAGPDGLDLAPELLDDDPRNGELHPDGVALVGGREIAVLVLAADGDEDDPPERLFERVPDERLARLVARVEETSFRNSLLDSDDPLEPDPERDVVFERARLGLADDVDTRPSAEARYAFRGMRERYGMVRSREAILPVELVVQGSLSDLALGAFPRLRTPRQTPDALLYRE